LFFYKILLDIMDKKSMSIPDVARATGLHDSTIRSIINRKSKSVALDVAAKISQGLDIDISALNGGDISAGRNVFNASANKNGFICLPVEQQHIKKYRALDGHGKRIVDFILDSEHERTQQVNALRIYNDEVAEEISMAVYWESAAAGFGNYLSGDNNNFEMMSFPATEVPPKADFGIRISGNSMEPGIYDGDIVWVEATPEINSGEVGIFVLNGESYCKELQISSSSKGRAVSLISHNNAYSPVNVKEGDTLRTVGRVLIS